MDLSQLLLAESRSGAARVDETPILPVSKVQGSETRARAFGLRVSHDREVPRAVQPHLDPVGRAPGAIGRIGLLADDALEAEAGGLREESIAVLLDVIGKAQRSRSRQQTLQE